MIIFFSKSVYYYFSRVKFRLFFSLCLLYVFFSSASHGGDNFSPLVFKEIYSKEEALCGEVFSFVKKMAINNYRDLTDTQKETNLLSHMTTQGKRNLLNVGGSKSILWSNSEVRFERPDGVRVRSDEFIYADINNDSKSEYVVKVRDSNDLSDGYGWWVFPGFNPSAHDFLPLSLAKKSIMFTYRDNNINGSYDDAHEAVSRNFHFNFVVLNERVYVLLILHYGYSFVFQENFILADLGEDFYIKNQYCHYELTMNEKI